TTTNSGKEQNKIISSDSIGADVGLDVRAEHTVLINSFAINGNHGIDYGVRGGNIYHTSAWVNPGCGEVARCLTLGADMQTNTKLDIVGMDMEDAASGIFAPVYHAIETTSGNTSGIISYSRTIQGTGNTLLAAVFDGGGGKAFTTQNNSMLSFNNA